MPKRNFISKSDLIQQNAQLQQQVFVLSVNKLVSDYVYSRGKYVESTEKYFEDWLHHNFQSWTPKFEQDLLTYFVQILLSQGNPVKKETK